MPFSKTKPSTETSVPAAWAQTYANAQGKTITRENYFEFIA